MFKKYDLRLKGILSGDIKVVTWKDVLQNHKLMLERIQHERLIHLLVTMFVGEVTVLFFLATIITKITVLAILDLVLIFLFAGYIFHYWFLENTTQKWYRLEDDLRKRV